MRFAAMQADEQSPFCLGEEEGEHAQRFGHAALNGAVGPAEGGDRQREHGVQRADHGGKGQLTDRVVFHFSRILPFFI